MYLCGLGHIQNSNGGETFVGKEPKRNYIFILNPVVDKMLDIEFIIFILVV